MPVTINGNGSVTGISAGGLPDNIVDGGNIALGSDAAGDIMYYNGTDYIRLGKPGSDLFLKNTSGGTVSWGTPAASGRKYTHNAWVATTSGTEIEFTSIAATNQFYIDWADVGIDANQDLCCQIGDSGGYETSGYHNAAGSLGDPSSTSDTATDRWKNYNNASGGCGRFGRMSLQLLHDNIWLMTFFYIADTEHPTYCWHGTKTLSGTLDRIKFYASGGAAFDEGKMRYVKVEDL